MNEIKLGDIFPETVLKLSEACYFMCQMLDTYHKMDFFIFNLNATVQAIRNITFMLQSELGDNSTLQKWYESKQEDMRSNKSLKNFKDARNTIVKKGSLQHKSTLQVGLFRGYQFKLGMGGDVPITADSYHILKKAQETFYNLYVDPEHTTIGEQLGVKREWYAEDLSNDEVVTACNNAIDYFGDILLELATLLNANFKWKIGTTPLQLAKFQVLLESDVDPSLPKKWGWVS